MAKATMGLRRGPRACAAVVVLALVGLAATAASASALPARFWGVVPQAAASSEQLARLHRGGVGSIRVAFDWTSLQSQRGATIDWSGVDSMVEKATANGIAILPFLTGAPAWAVPQGTVRGSGGAKAPARLPIASAAAAGWREFVQQAVLRYGSTGSFWVAHPTLPALPIRTWQIWNEPNFKYFVAKPNPTEYGKLVKASNAAIKSVDPGAKVVLAGLFGRPKGSRTKSGKHKSLNWYAKDFLEAMYKANPGIKSSFAGVALHPYTPRYQELPEEIEEIRNLLKDEKDSGKGLWITELGWSSEPPDPAIDQFAKGLAGQARELRGAFGLLRNKAANWKLKQVYWFSVDDVDGACNFCGGAGLFGAGFKPKKAWFEYVKFAGGTP
jgi:hypothetical protein